jgi:hypothetical protein
MRKQSMHENEIQLFSAGGPTPADTALADQIRRGMNGPRLGQSVQGSNVYYARVIVDTVKGRELEARAAVIAVTTAITESGLRNYTQAVDHDSLGLFQQRPSQGWGTPAQLTDPVYATNAFLNAMLRKYPNGAWKTGDIGAICQRVQVSAYPDAYGHEVHDAQLLVDALWKEAGAPHVPTAQGDRMQPGQVLNPGESIASANGRFRFTYQADGNLVLYRDKAALWASGTNGRGVGVCIMQTDGNLVLYGPDGAALWASGTNGFPGSYLVVQDDGNVVIYRPALWSTNTWVPIGPSARGDRMQPGQVLNETGTNRGQKDD